MRNLIIIVVLAAFTTLTGMAGENHTISRNIVVEGSADQVWSILRKLDGVEQYAGGMVTHSKLKGKPGVGCERICTMNNGMQVKEKIIAFDDSARTYTYEVSGAPVPVKAMVNTARVVDLGYNRSLLVWTSNFKPKPEADVKQITMMMGGMLEMTNMEVKKLIETNNS